MSDFVNVKGPFAVRLTVLQIDNLQTDAFIGLVTKDSQSLSPLRLNSNLEWQHQFPAISVNYKSKFGIKLHGNTTSEPVAQWRFSVRKLYKKKDMPEGIQSSFDMTLNDKKRLGKGKLYCRFEITWPAELHSLGGQGKADWARAQQTPEPVADQLRAIGCHQVFIQDLEQLVNFDIAIICDDSGSMVTRTKEHRTRWEELRANVETLVQICCVLDEDGIDVLFLNRNGARQVKNLEQIAGLFKAPPCGRTPMTEALLKAFSLRRDKPLIVVAITDGEPNNVDTFCSALANRDKETYVSIIACTDNRDDVRFLDGLDKQMDRLDVLDDYASERAQVLRCQGAVDYSLGDHCARMLLGSVFEKYDKLDEMAW